MQEIALFSRKLHSWHKFYTTAGRDSRDKSQLYREQSKDYIKLDQVTLLLSAIVLIGIYLYQKKQELHKNFKGLCQDLSWQS